MPDLISLLKLSMFEVLDMHYSFEFAKPSSALGIFLRNSLPGFSQWNFLFVGVPLDEDTYQINEKTK